MHPRSSEEQQGRGLHEEELDPVSTSSPGSFDGKVSSPGGESIQGVHSGSDYARVG